MLRKSVGLFLTLMVYRKFLITGASGFVGRKFVPQLCAAYGTTAVTALVNRSGREIEQRAVANYRAAGMNVIEADLLDRAKPKLGVDPFDVVYHLAGFGETEDPRGPFQVNNTGTENLLEWLGESLRGRLAIYTGTLASVDRDHAEGPIREETPCTPKTPYGRTKLEGEGIVRRAAAKYGFDYVILRLCTIVGRDFRPGGMLGIFPRLLAKGAIVTRLNWPGRTSFLSNADLAKILVKVPEVPETRNQTYVLSNHEGLSFDELLEVIAGVLDLRRKRVVLPNWLWRVSRKFAWAVASSPAPYRMKIACWRLSHLMSDGLYADASKLNRALGGFEYQSVKEALREAYFRA